MDSIWVLRAGSSQYLFPNNRLCSVTNNIVRLFTTVEIDYASHFPTQKVFETNMSNIGNTSKWPQV